MVQLLMRPHNTDPRSSLKLIQFAVPLLAQGGIAQLQSIPKSSKELALGISAIGLSSVGYDTARSMIDVRSKVGDITRSNASRMRKMISLLSQQIGAVSSQDLIEEIKDKVDKLAAQELGRWPKAWRLLSPSELCPLPGSACNKTKTECTILTVTC